MLQSGRRHVVLKKKNPFDAPKKNSLRSWQIKQEQTMFLSISQLFVKNVCGLLQTQKLKLWYALGSCTLKSTNDFYRDCVCNPTPCWGIALGHL